MTTIATDGKTMAADSLAVGDYVVPIKASKIWKKECSIKMLPTVLFGGCGHYGTICKFYDTRPYEDFDFKCLDDDEFLQVTDTRIEKLDKSGCWYDVGEIAAIGSGAREAMAAMKAGATPYDAVKIASELDPYTGGEIVEISL